jgi:hypothetical protein
MEEKDPPPAPVCPAFEPPEGSAHQPTAEEEVEEIVRQPVWKRAKVMIPLWAAIFGLLLLGLQHNVDARLMGGALVLVGLLSNAFAWLVGLIGLVPLVGPLLVKILAIPFIWLLNAIGYLVSVVAIRRGYSRDVLTYRGITIALLIGITIGFILGKLL